MARGKVHLVGIVGTIATLGILAGLRSQSAGEPRVFKPARIAVVNISAVFENYQKKKDVEGRLEQDIKEEEKKFQELQGSMKSYQEELKNVQEGTDKHKELTLKSRELEYEIKNREKELLKQFQEKQINALKEIRNEITTDIEKYAAGLEIDLVLEKQVAAEGKGNAVHWPIVHYAKPEIEITDEIVARLNAQYGAPSAAPQGVGKGKK